MVSFPNCKINLGLHIVEKRLDGYHNLETVFYPILLKDALEVIPYYTATYQQQNNSKIEFSQSGIQIDGDASNNLCVKAYHLLSKDFPTLPAAKMHLHKFIPMGAGMGGGSADGAFALSMLNEVFHLQLTEAQLLGYALALGSDCPFFIINKPCFATGRGEQLQPIELDLSAYHIVIVNPQIHINTGWAFSQIVPQQPIISILDIVKSPVGNWKHQLINDFEQPAEKQFPAIADIKNELYHQGAIYSAMTGSGSTVFGLFEKHTHFKNTFPSQYFVFQS